MSTEQDTERIAPESIFRHFKRFKVAISDAIKTPYPFFELLRDSELITNKMYDEFKESCRNLIPVKNVAYRALEVLEERFEPEVLKILFCKENVKEYPDLEHIFRSFKNVLHNKLCSHESDRGDPDSQLSLEQGPGDSCSQESLTWLPSDPSSSDGWRSNDRRTTTLIQGNQTENHPFSSPQIQTVVSLSENGLPEDLYETAQINQVGRDTAGDDADEQEKLQATKLQGPDSESEESCKIEVQLNDEHALLEPHSPLPWSEENIKKENSSFFSDGTQQAHTRTNHNQASEVIVLSSEDSDDENNCSEDSALVNWSNEKEGSQLLSLHNSWPPVSAGSSYPKGDGDSHQATLHSSLHVPLGSKKPLTSRKTHKRRVASDTDSFCSRKKPKNTRRTTDVEKNFTSRKGGGKIRKKRTRHRKNLIRNIKIPMNTSKTKAFPRRHINYSSQRGRKRGRRIPRQINADFNHPELPVTCGNAKGTLYKEKFKRGIHEKSIESENGQWFTLREFEIEGKREPSKNWRQSIRCYGWPLKELIEERYLPNPPRERKKKENPPNPQKTKKKLKNSKQCKVCGQGRKLYCCAICRKYYHKKCHIPPVEDKSELWSCVFCKTKDLLGYQENQVYYKESEVLKRKMLPEEQLKCELLLLTIYCNSKSDFFIPKPTQRKENFPDLQEHMWLNKIKNRLNKKAYHSVQRFVEDMRLIFQNHSILYKGRKFKTLGDTVGSLFEETFKRTFSISEQLQPRMHTVLLT